MDGGASPQPLPYLAVHVRRGDISFTTPVEADGTSRFLPMPLVANCIARTLEVLRHEVQSRDPALTRAASCLKTIRKPRRGMTATSYSLLLATLPPRPSPYMDSGTRPCASGRRSCTPPSSASPAGRPKGKFGLD